MRGATLLAAAALAAGAGAVAASPPPPLAAGPSAEAILGAVDRLMAPEQFEAELEMTAHRPDGTARPYRLHAWKKGRDRFRARFDEPAAVRGQEALRVGDGMWQYLPNLKRALRVSPKQEFQGGDFSNTDLLRVHLADDYAPARLPDEGDAFVLELRARRREVSYDRVKLWVGRADGMPRREELYAQSGKLLRVLELSEPRAFGAVRRPAYLVMRNMLAPRRFTELRVRALTPRADLGDGLFQLSALGR